MAGFEDLPKRVPDCTKIQQLIGWAPQQTFDMILDDVIRSVGLIRFDGQVACVDYAA